MQYEQTDDLTQLRLNLPDAPGVYKYFDETGKIIYVGKAKSLKKRVNSYFTKNTSHDHKTTLLVKRIKRIEFVLTNDDLEALLLENNLIKEYQPKYNILLRDGKSYPFICISHEPFPRVFPTRNRVKDKSLYFGPYPSAATMHAILRFIRENFKLRTCNLSLSKRNIDSGKFRACLEYQIGKCNAPCIGLQPVDEYEEDIKQIRQILRGNFKAVTDHLKTEMQKAAANLDFERAHFMKNRLEHIQKHKRKSTVVSETIDNVEVITLVSRDNLTIANHFKMIHGTVVKHHVFDVWQKNDEAEEEIFTAVMSRLAAEDEDFCKVVLTNLEILPADFPVGFQIFCPRRGDQLKIVELSIKNCEQTLEDKLNFSKEKFDDRAEKLLLQVQKDLRLTNVPYHIEGFDNSNIQGYAPVSSCVVFKNGKPSKKDYRVFNVETVEGPNDFASMYEAVTKRYRRAVAEGKPLPDLILIDGGKGQLSSAMQALKDLGIETQVPMISIAKRLEEIYYKDDPVPLYIDKKSPTLKLLQNIRNESHNTAITFHRKKRDAKTLKTELTEIKGVGKVTAGTLLAKLKSVKKIKAAELSELTEIIGESKAKIVYEYYRRDSTENN